MKYNILTDTLPDRVEIGGTEYAICADFRTSIRFEILLRDKEIPDDTKMMQMLTMYYPEIPEDTEQAIEWILWFYNCGKEEHPETEEREKRGATRRQSAVKYSFAQDDAYIYSSFIEQYGINLQQIKDKDLHWWEFVALFESLSDQTKMGQVIYYRTVSTSGMPNAKRKAINEMKKIYALKDDTSCDSKIALAKRNANWKDYVKRRMEDR